MSCLNIRTEEQEVIQCCPYVSSSAETKINKELPVKSQFQVHIFL